MCRPRVGKKRGVECQHGNGRESSCLDWSDCRAQNTGGIPAVMYLLSSSLHSAACPLGFGSLGSAGENGTDYVTLCVCVFVFVCVYSVCVFLCVLCVARITCW